MRHENEAALLRAIAEEPGDGASYLVLADFLEEHGDSSRAEYLRVQAELATKGIKKKRVDELRQRERGLLNAHRQQWVAAFHLPLEDVRFEHGVVASARFSKWDSKFHDADRMARLVTLNELDLSDLKLGDGGLTAFAQKANFPVLRKLILSGNGITDAGVKALAKATGLPKLDTVFLFGNSLSGQADVLLEEAEHFRLGLLDRGVPKDGYAMSPGEAEVARRQFIRTHLLPLVTSYFQKYEHLQSAVLAVAQYWNDEASDAVHGELIVSELFEPSLHFHSYSDDPDPNIPNTKLPQPQYGPMSSSISFWDEKVPWEDNYGAIPLWAAYAPEGGSQEYGNLDEVYSPAVKFYRHGGFEFLPMSRPQLDGIQPEEAP